MQNDQKCLKFEQNVVETSKNLIYNLEIVIKVVQKL